MRVYLTKVWGFHAPVGPLQFGRSGWRDRARTLLTAGDLVALVGTKGEETDLDERGRVLGLVEPTTEPVMSLDFDLPTRPQDFDEGKNYRWPFGLHNRRAWRIVDPPLLSDLTGRRRFGMAAAQGIVALTDTEAGAILALPREEVSLLVPRFQARSRIGGATGARKRISPPPTDARRGIMHMRKAPAYTYAFEILGAEVSSYKIGWAFEYALRARQFNQAAMPELGGLRYKPVLDHLWGSAREAYRMEQSLLSYFFRRRHGANHEIVCRVGYEELLSVWRELIERGR